MSHQPVVIDNLVKIYNPHRPDLAVRALDGVSFSVARGEACAIIGPSGCGKSTLLHILGCLDQPTAGSYRLEGEEVKNLSEPELARARNQHIGFVFQSFNLLPRLSALENVELPLRYAGHGKRSREMALDALARVGLEARGKHRPNELSGGQRQRVAIARAIVTRPSILLCDEPTGALDSKTGKDVLALLQQLGTEGTTLIMVTHDLAIARQLGRVVYLRDGRVVADGASHAVVDQMLHEVGDDLHVEEEAA
ncbi:MAG: ABC transporter ATP-binding protein [Deltaproteobacteria bacterium]|nr:ABC transporter ATP-binding protein [Deltaproteobacteria bacterium]